MQNANIISLIDAHVERLLKVRRILAELNLPLSRRKVVTPTPNRTAQSKSAKRGNASRKTSKSTVRKPYTERMSVAPTEDRSASPTAVSGFQRDAIAPNKPITQAIEKSVLSGTTPVACSLTTQPSRKKPVTQKPSVRSGTFALGGNIPSGPIVVPAEQIRYEQSLRQRESAIKERDPFQIPSDVPLTAELLAQRWMQGANAPVTKTAMKGDTTFSTPRKQLRRAASFSQ
ncbi:hypothetical protein BDD14_0206 [Edaphobacter modestus]|uniref:Uncharacterized protein n=1 Tax=Edaphobacter modestus TaxID=388466 RepID=A0A4Q7YND7_9BACT|nr:hypothetical protein BDD14_0206 [Edaphobacter modestus]